MTNDVTKIPDFLIVGAAKSGTSSLHSYLSRHPDIYMPKKRKELYFWHVATNSNRSIIDHVGEGHIPTRLDEYLEYFENARKGQVTGEACPSYLYFHDHVQKNLKQHHANWKDVKIIIILREPVSRIVSQYRFVCKNRLDPEFLSFSDSLKAEPERVNENKLLPDLFYTEVSKYSKQVNFYIENFNNVHVCLYDDMKDKPKEVLGKLCEFLNVSVNRLPEFEFDVVNSSAGSRRIRYPLLIKSAEKVGRPLFRWLPDCLKSFLKSRFEIFFSEPIVIPQVELSKLDELFVPEIRKLEVILGRDLSCWKRRK